MKPSKLQITVIGIYAYLIIFDLFILPEDLSQSLYEFRFISANELMF